MHIVEARALNWVRYRGDHVLSLTPTVYGVTSERDGNSDVSNWGGKSTLLHLIRFVVFGKRPPSSATEDGWITRGEAEGGGGLRLSDGTTIERRRQRGKATRLAVEFPDGRKAFDADAQTALEEHIGLTDDDFCATCFFKQKEISRFVTAKPSDRMAIIAGWLKLEPLQRAEKRVRAALGTMLDTDSKLVAEEAVHRDAIVRYLLKFFDDVGSSVTLAEVETEMVDVIGVARAKATASKTVAEKKRDEAKKLADWKRASADARRYRELLTEVAGLGDPIAINTLLAKLQGTMAEGRRRLDVVSGECRVATDKQVQASRLACGEFDGRCPVDGHSCPDKPKMNAARASNRKLAEAAQSELIEAKRAHVDLKAVVDSQLLEQAGYQRVLRNIEAVTEQASRLKAAADRIARDGEPSVECEVEREATIAWETYQLDESEARDVVRVFDSIKAEFLAIARCCDSRAAMKKSIETHQQACVILGKTGAQRRIAEGALGEITAMANSSLQESGIDLRVEVAWSREGTGLSEECQVCGSAYGKGRGIKECPRCGAARGPKTIEKVEVNLSDVSGAAEDIAGVVLQLSAGAWLRSQRNTAWSVACIDEAFGALDGANCKALATHLVSLLRGCYGFEQSFLVAHTRGVTDSMPGRIVIRADATKSVPEVM